MAKKGISPLVAAVLLIAFTVAIGTLVFTFITTNIKATTDVISNRTAESIDCTSAGINIEDVFIAGSTARIIVKNTGFTDDMTIRDLQLYNITGHNFTTSQVPLFDFDRGEIVTLTVSNVNVSTCPNGFSRVLVSSTCGGISDAFTGTPKCG